MNKNNTAITVTTILCALFFIVVGSCFSAFLYEDEIVKVEKVNVIASEGVQVFDKDGKKEIEKLELSTLKLGLKPATGEEDATTKIPTTVHEKQGTEGVFAKFKVNAKNGAKIFVTNIKFSGKVSEKVIEEERENVMVSISQISESTNSLKKEKVLLGEISGSEESVDLTLFVWLSASISDKFNSETISFDLLFE